MAVKVIRDGEVVYSDKKPSVEQVLEQQAQIIQDLQNQIKDLQKQKQNKK
jgi:hypothetical protein